MNVGRACCALFAMLVFGGAPVAASASASDAAACPYADAGSGASPEDMSAATLCLVNAERAAAGQRPLSSDPTLGNTARAYAAVMVSAQRFAHKDANGGGVADRVRAVGGSLDPWLELGENLGWGSLSAGTPRAIVSGWMGSPTHRDNILYSPFTRLGVGIVDGAPSAEASGGLTYVAVFGRTAPRRSATSKRCARARARARATRSKQARARATRACRSRSG